MEAHRLDPSSPFPYANLCDGYVALRQLAEAKAIATKGLDMRPGLGDLQQCRLTVAYLERDGETMRHIIETSANTPAALEVLIGEGRVMLARGQVKDAGAHFERVERLARTQGREAGMAEGFAAIAVELVTMEHLVPAERYADRALALTNDADAPWSLPHVYYSAGRIAKAAALHATLAKRLAADGDFQATWGPIGAAAAAMARGDHAAAVDAMRPAQAVERSMPGATLLRGLALLRAGKAEDAALAFQFAIDNRFTAEPSALGTAAHIWLARARARLGDVPAARRAYQDVFATWKDADPDLPLLVQARKEYAALPPDGERR